MVLDSIVEKLEKEVESLKGHAAKEIKEIVIGLARGNSRLRLRPRVKEGNRTFSLVWVKYSGYDPVSRSPIKQEVPKGRGHLISQDTLMSYLADCEAWEQEFIWEKEQELAQIREQAGLLSQALAALNQYAKV